MFIKNYQIKKKRIFVGSSSQCLAGWVTFFRLFSLSLALSSYQDDNNKSISPKICRKFQFLKQLGSQPQQQLAMGIQSCNRCMVRIGRYTQSLPIDGWIPTVTVCQCFVQKQYSHTRLCEVQSNSLSQWPSATEAMIPLCISHSFASVFASMRSGDRNKEMELFYLHGTKYCSYRNAKIGQYYSCVTNIPGRTHFLHSFGSLRMTSRDLYFCQLGARKDRASGFRDV